MSAEPRTAEAAEGDGLPLEKRAGPSGARAAFAGSYRLLGVVAAAHSVSHMHAALLPIIYPMVMTEFGLDYAALGLIMAVGDALGNLLQGTYGSLSKRVMRRTLLGLGNLMLGVSMVVTAASVGFASFLSGNVLGRLAKSPQHPVGSSLIADSFGKRLRGRALAVDFAGGNAGTLLVPFLGTYLVAAYGWRTALVAFAVAPVVTGLFALRSIPEDVREGSAPSPGGGAGARLAGFARDFAAPLRHRPVALVVLAATLAAGGRGIGVIMVYVPLYLSQSVGLEGTEYASLFTLLMIGGVIGPLFMGHLSDVFSRGRVLTAAYVLSATSMVGLIAAGATWLLAPAVVLLGLVVYAQSSLVRALLADVAPEGGRSAAYSTFYVISYLGGSLWSIALGLTVDGYGFEIAFAVMAASYLAALAVVTRVRDSGGGGGV